MKMVDTNMDNINEYTFDDIQIGMTEEFEVTITTKMMDSFKMMTGDINPLHCNREYAISKGYSDRVVYGMLTSSFYSTLVGVYLPGKHCLLHSVESKLVKPVYIGDTLNITGTVKEKHDVFKRITIKSIIRNQNSEIVSKAKIILETK